jgi:predicted NBD/HSP70 family sugar kinase
MRAIPASLRLANQRLIIEKLLLSSTSTRAELAKGTGISQPTAGKIIDDLLEAGVVEEIGDGHRAREPRGGAGERVVPLGRPGRTLRLSRRIPRLLLVHLGVEKTQLTALPASLPVEESWSVEFATPKTAASWTRRLQSAAQELELAGVWGTIMSVPGVVDERRGRILFSPNLHWSEKISLFQILQEIRDVPVCLLNEVRALALGELTANSGETDFLQIEFGEGVGGAVVINGRLYNGPLPLSGEIGHTPVLGVDRPCGCGARGCLETLMAERGILESFAESGGKERGGWSAVRVALAADPVPDWLTQSFGATAGCVAGVINTFGIRRVVLSGVVMKHLPDRTVQHLQRAIEQAAMWSRFESVSCVVAPMRRVAGLVLAGIQNLVIPTDWGRREQQM